MKLKNKISGEIKEFALFDGEELQGGATLESLTKEWEDCDEPKEYYFINSLGEVIRPSDTTDWIAEDIAYHKEIGNYFESKEEAEKAVERLKKLQNLKNRGYNIDEYIDMIIERGEE